MLNGYIKLWRKSLDTSIWEDSDLWKTFCCCLLLANHKEAWFVIPGIKTPIRVKPGQFITGRFEFHKTMYPKKKKRNKSPLTAWRWLKILEKLEILNIKSYNKFSIITVTNWHRHQKREQQTNNRRTTDEHKQEGLKNDKEPAIRKKDHLPLVKNGEFVNE